MTLVSLVITLLVVGFILWLIGQLPIDNTIKQIIYGVVILFVIVWLLQSFGVLGHVGAARID